MFKLAVFLSLIFFFVAPSTGQTAPTSAPAVKQAPPAVDRVRLKLDTSEAEAVLAIISQSRTGKPVADADWQRLFLTEPYRRLKKREAEMKRDFTDDEFKKFVLSDETVKNAPQLAATLAGWKQADLNGAAGRALAYLPAEARIHAKIFPVIKPGHNSFVYELAADPTIFFYLDPSQSAAQFENTAAHELHHIGDASMGPTYEKLIKELPANAQSAASWMGAFGEGMAMLAAAGGPEVHPHLVSNQKDRERWDRDMANSNRDLARVDQFLLDIIHGKLTEGDQREQGMSFFGIQGPWYTVGYKMAVMVEKRYGRAALVECISDPRKLLRRYNMAAAAYNATHEDKLERWSEEVLEVTGGHEKPEAEPATVPPVKTS